MLRNVMHSFPSPVDMACSSSPITHNIPHNQQVQPDLKNVRFQKICGLPPLAPAGPFFNPVPWHKLPPLLPPLNGPY